MALFTVYSLMKRGINAVKYHGKLSDAVKLSSQSKWMSGEVKSYCGKLVIWDGHRQS